MIIFKIEHISGDSLHLGSPRPPRHSFVFINDECAEVAAAGHRSGDGYEPVKKVPQKSKENNQIIKIKGILDS